MPPRFPPAGPARSSRKEKAEQCRLLPRAFSGLIIRVGEGAGQQLMAGSRTRRKSICASATRRASSMVSALAPGPAISRASVSTSSDNAGLEQTGRLSPWRSAFLAARARPWAVSGRCWRAHSRGWPRFCGHSSIRVPPSGWGRLDRFKLGALDFLHVPSQRLAEELRRSPIFPAPGSRKPRRTA